MVHRFLIILSIYKVAVRCNPLIFKYTMNINQLFLHIEYIKPVIFKQNIASKLFAEKKWE